MVIVVMVGGWLILRRPRAMSDAGAGDPPLARPGLAAASERAAD